VLFNAFHNAEAQSFLVLVVFEGNLKIPLTEGMELDTGRLIAWNKRR